MAVILPEQKGEQGYETAEKLRKAVERYSEEIEGLKITLSFGVSTLDNSTESVESLIKRSDAALYEAKKRGRNCTEQG